MDTEQSIASPVAVVMPQSPPRNELQGLKRKLPNSVASSSTTASSLSPTSSQWNKAKNDLPKVNKRNGVDVIYRPYEDASTK